MSGAEAVIVAELNAMRDPVLRAVAARAAPCFCWSDGYGFHECGPHRIAQEAYREATKLHGVPTLSEWLEGRHPLACEPTPGDAP